MSKKEDKLYDRLEKTVKMTIGGKKVKIDKKIAKDIKKLNEKGYRTRYSCSGHMSFYDGNPTFGDFYVTIDKVPKDIDFNKFIRNIPKELSVEIEYSRDGKYFNENEYISCLDYNRPVITIRGNETLMVNASGYKYKFGDDIYKGVFCLNNAIARQAFHKFVKSL